MNIQPSGSVALPSTQLTGQPAGPTKTAPVANVAAAPPAPAGEPNAAELMQAVASINATVQKLAPGLEFSVDQESNRTIVRVVDQQTKELIRQMPSAETLEIAKALDRVQGLLIRLRA